jgi:hypothetical protein
VSYWPDWTGCTSTPGNACPLGVAGDCVIDSCVPRQNNPVGNCGGAYDYCDD